MQFKTINSREAIENEFIDHIETDHNLLKRLQGKQFS